MKFWQVDAFTSQPFKGNPAAVFILDRDIEDELKQKIAEEMNLSETVFVLPQGEGFEIRWFTPSVEVDLCGHATLAAAHILWQQRFIQQESVTFSSKSGPICVLRQEAGYTLDFPKQPPIEKIEYLPLISEILTCKPLYIGSNQGDCMVVVEDSSLVRSFIPKLRAIENLPERGFLLTAADEKQQCDYIYRAFFPKLSIPEDPVTGSANTILGPYWAQHYKKNLLQARQVSARGGTLGIEVTLDRVRITGQAVTVVAAEMLSY